MSFHSCVPFKLRTFIGFQGAQFPFPCNVIPLVCSFQIAYFYRLPRGAIPFSFMCWNLHASHLTFHRVTHLLSPKVTILHSTHFCSQDITLPPTIGTPTPNGLKSRWDFISRRSLVCWQV